MRIRACAVMVFILSVITAAYGGFSSNLKKLKDGMSKSEVEKILGKPTETWRVDRDLDVETWAWYQRGRSHSEFATIVFNGDRAGHVPVVAHTTFGGFEDLKAEARSRSEPLESMARDEARRAKAPATTAAALSELSGLAQKLTNAPPADRRTLWEQMLQRYGVFVGRTFSASLRDPLW